MISDRRCSEILNSFLDDGETILLGEGSNNVICRASKNGLSALIIEIDSEAEACKNYLLRIGVKKFLNHEQVMEHYGWDGEIRITTEAET